MDWTPVSDKNPDKDGQYVVTLEDIDGELSVNTRIFTNGHWRTNFGAITAWAEMPEPYRKGE